MDDQPPLSKREAAVHPFLHDAILLFNKAVNAFAAGAN